jgi:DnaJ-class molecular chaperone
MEAQTIQCQRCNGDGEEYVDLHPVRCGGCQGTGRITDDSAPRLRRFRLRTSRS